MGIEARRSLPPDAIKPEPPSGPPVTTDPFEKAKAIRRGALDDELPSFDEITGWIQRAPKTWLPAILRQAITCCVVGNVFRDGKMLPFVKRCEAAANDPNISVLREDDDAR